MQGHDSGIAEYKTLIDKLPISRMQWGVFILCFLVMLLDGLDTVLIGFLAPAISRDWHLDKVALTPAFTAGLVGLMISGCLAGIMADRVGRRPLVITAVLLFGCANLATAFCHGVVELTALRLVTGLGLGAAMPCAVTLVSELAPNRRRALIITTMYAGYTLGGAVGGWLTSLVVPAMGWRAMFGVGALLPLVTLPFLLAAMPESVAFLAERRRDLAAVGKLLSKIAGHPVRVGLPAAPADARTSPLRAILSGPARRTTGLLWLANGSGLLITFTLINWLPSLLTFKQIPMQTAAQSGAFFQAGGALGAVLTGWLIDRSDAGRITMLAYVAAALLCLAWLAAFTGSVPVLLTLGFLVGVVVMGGQTGLQVIATQVYAPTMRATGLSWMQSIGRLGGVLGIQLAGWGVAAGIDSATLLQALAIPALLAAAAVKMLGAGSRMRQAPAAPLAQPPGTTT